MVSFEERPVSVTEKQQLARRSVKFERARSMELPGSDGEEEDGDLSGVRIPVTSHQRQPLQAQEAEEKANNPKEVLEENNQPKVVTRGEEPAGWSAESIARRKFTSMVVFGAGMPVLKHNRNNKCRVRRVLKFDAQVRRVKNRSYNGRNNFHHARSLQWIFGKMTMCAAPDSAVSGRV